MDRAGPGISSGQEGLAAHPFSMKRPAGARPIHGAPAFTWPASGTPYFGWQVACFQTTCTDGGTEWLSVELLELNMAETTGPAISANRRPLGHGEHLDPRQLAVGLRRRLALRRLQPQRFAERHQHPGIRARRRTRRCFTSAPRRPCSRRSTPPSTATARCRSDSAPAMPPACRPSAGSTVYVDNEPVSLSLSGPTDAPVSAGTQYITATASAGPSGVDGIECSLDGSPYQFYSGSSTQLAVQGVGVHHASCFARNNAVAVNGVRATSPAQNWTLSIREPSVATVAFSRVVNALRCSKKHVRVRIPAHWTTVAVPRAKGPRAESRRRPARSRSCTAIRGSFAAAWSSTGACTS